MPVIEKHLFCKRFNLLGGIVAFIIALQLLNYMIYMTLYG